MIFAAFVIVWAGWNWYTELQPYLNRMYRIKYHSFVLIAVFQRLYCLLINTTRLFTDGKYFLLDVAITFMCAETLGFGKGFEGGVMGIFISNVVSAIILIIMIKNGQLVGDSKIIKFVSKFIKKNIQQSSQI